MTPRAPAAEAGVRAARVSTVCAFGDVVKKTKGVTEWVDGFADHISDAVQHPECIRTKRPAHEEMNTGPKPTFL